MILRNKVDGKLYDVSSSESYDDSIVLEYSTLDGSASGLSGIAYNGGRTKYNSIAQMSEHWEDQVTDVKDLNKTTELIFQWFDDKGLSDPVMQFAKFNEEAGEIAHELTRGHYRTLEMMDAIGDTYVTLVGMAHHLGLDLAKCARMAYDEIKNRKGKVVDGSFVKEQ